jgi:excinuclease ABC subunit C
MIAPPTPVAAKLPHLPESPGVYLWKDADGKVLYVGKAKRLRSRVRSYFASDHPRARRRAASCATCGTSRRSSSHRGARADPRANLIKEYRPRFNIALKDDKNYPYIKVTVQEPYPRVFVTRRLQSDGARYFGPYTDVGRMRQALNVVKRIFTVRSCNYDMPREMPERACLDFAIKRCKAPCIGNQSLEDYRAMVDEVTVFLDGKTDEVVRRISARMEEASERLDFERAGELRDALRHLQRMQEPTVVLELEGGDRDVVGYARDGDDACVAVMRIRGGKLLARDHRFLENIDEGDDDPIVLAAFLARSYLGGPRSAPTSCSCRSTSTTGRRSRSRSPGRGCWCRSAARAASSSTSPSRTRGTSSRSTAWRAWRRRSAPPTRCTSSSASSG